MPTQSSFTLDSGIVAFPTSKATSTWAGLTPGVSYTVKTWQWMNSSQTWVVAGQMTKVASSSTETFTYNLGLSLSGARTYDVFLWESITYGSTTEWGANKTFFDGVPPPQIVYPTQGSTVETQVIEPRVRCYRNSAYPLWVSLGSSQQSPNIGDTKDYAEVTAYFVPAAAICQPNARLLTASQDLQTDAVNFTHYPHGSVTSVTSTSPAGGQLMPGTYQFSWTYTGSAIAEHVSTTVSERRAGQWYTVASAAGTSVTATISSTATEAQLTCLDHGRTVLAVQYTVGTWQTQEGSATIVTSATFVVDADNRITADAVLVAAAALEASSAIVNPSSATDIEAISQVEPTAMLFVSGGMQATVGAEFIHDPPIIPGELEILGFAIVEAVGRRYAVRRLPPAGVSRLPRV